MLFIDVHIWTYCRNISVVKILRVLARARGVTADPPSPWHRHELGVGRRAGGFNPSTPNNSNIDPNPNPNPTTKKHTVLIIQLNIVSHVLRIQRN